MTIIARITAAIITPMFGPSPTAVITESSEKTMSITTICAMILASAPELSRIARAPGLRGLCESHERFSSDRKRPPAIMTRLRPEISWPRSWKSGFSKCASRKTNESSSTARNEREQKADGARLFAAPSAAFRRGSR